MLRQTLFVRDVDAADAGVRHGIARDFQHAPHASQHHACIPNRMLPDECERLARALAVASNTVRPLHFSGHVRRPAGALALDLRHLIVAEDESVLLSELRFAESFPEIRADRSASRREVGKDDVVAYDDRRD